MKKQLYYSEFCNGVHQASCHIIFTESTQTLKLWVVKKPSTGNSII